MKATKREGFEWVKGRRNERMIERRVSLTGVLYPPNDSFHAANQALDFNHKVVFVRQPRRPNTPYLRPSCKSTVNHSIQHKAFPPSPSLLTALPNITITSTSPTTYCIPFLSSDTPCPALPSSTPRRGHCQHHR